MSDSNCVICFEPLASAPLGACVPCGHVLHTECFGGWEASSCGRSNARAKCPMCNTRCSTFTKLFLKLPMEEEDDDCDSLSSASTVATEDNELDGEGEGRRHGAENPGGCDSADGEDESEETQPEANEASRDDNSVIEILSDASPQRPRPTRSTSDSGAEVRIRRKAKRLKKRVKMLEKQRKDLIEQSQEALEKSEELKEQVMTLEDSLQAQRETTRSNTRELEASRLDLLRLRRELDNANQELQIMKVRTSKAESELAECMQRYQQDLESANVNACIEVKSILEQNRKLVEEHRKQKQYINKIESELEICRRAEAKRVSDQINNEPLRRKKQGKEIVKAYQEARCQEMRVADENELKKSSQVELHSRLSAKASAHTKRMSRAVINTGPRLSASESLLRAATRSHPAGGFAGNFPPRRQVSLSSEEQTSTVDHTDGEQSRQNGLSLHVSTTKRRKISKGSDGEQVGRVVAQRNTVSKRVEKEPDIRQMFQFTKRRNRH